MSTLIKGKDNCIFCNGTGYVEGSWGNKILCSCVIEQQNALDTPSYVSDNEEDKEMIPMPVSDIPVALQQAIAAGVFSEQDAKLEYSRAYASKSLSERCEALHLVISKKQVTDCLDTLDLILTDLRVSGKLPTKSYAIGSESGIGKTTFAITALKYAVLSGYKVVPCIDMSTLAEKYLDYSKEMRTQYNSIINGTKFDEAAHVKTFTWRDYVEADLAIVSLTGGNADIAYVELYTLLQLLLRRGTKNKPTIVLMRTTVDYYIHYDEIRRDLVRELFAMKGKTGTYQMLELHTMFSREPSVGT